MHVMGSLRY